MPEEIRALREEEVDSFIHMAAQAFRTGPADTRFWRSRTRVEELRGIFLDGQMRAVLRLIDMPIWFGEAPVATGGLSAVATPPENRRRGYIERLLHATLVEIREKGWPLSALYPFYFPFYKRYGWEHICDVLTYKIPVQQLPSGKMEGTWHPVMRGTDMEVANYNVPDADRQVLRGIYDEWARGRTGPVARNDWWWRRQLREGRDQRPDVYYWSDTQGRPRAYVIYRFENLGSEWDRRIVVDDMVALDVEALRAVLVFFRNHDSQAKAVKLILGEDTRLLSLLDDPRFEVQVEAGVMLRMVDVEQALSARRYAEGVEGRITLRVSDSFLDWNNGAYSLEVGDTRGQAARRDASPQISLDQRTLSRLYSGYLTASEAAELKLIEVHDPPALAEAGKIFAAPRPYMPDFF